MVSKLLFGASLARRSSFRNLGPAGLLLLGKTLLDQSSVSSCFGLSLLVSLKGELGSPLFTLKSNWSDEALNFDSLRDRFSLLVLERSGDHELPHVVRFVKVEQSANFVSTLRAESSRGGGIGDAGDVVVTFLDDNKVQDGKVRANDATANRFPLTLTRSASPVAREPVAKKESHSGIGQHTLFHWKALLIVATSNLEYLREVMGYQN